MSALKELRVVICLDISAATLSGDFRSELNCSGVHQQPNATFMQIHSMAALFCAAGSWLPRRIKESSKRWETCQGGLNICLTSNVLTTKYRYGLFQTLLALFSGLLGFITDSSRTFFQASQNCNPSMLTLLLSQHTKCCTTNCYNNNCESNIHSLFIHSFIHSLFNKAQAKTTSAFQFNQISLTQSRRHFPQSLGISMFMVGRAGVVTLDRPANNFDVAGGFTSAVLSSVIISL